MTDSNKSLRRDFSDAASPPSAQAADGFQYGWCKTDHKDGFLIDREVRAIDYMNDEPYATIIKERLEQAGLPLPKPEEIYRGSFHDLLFLNSHGLVIRIGPTYIEELMHPAILQPIGWFEEKEFQLGSQDAPFTFAIYGGIELFQDWAKIPEDKRPIKMTHLKHFFEETSQAAEDLYDDNRGIVRIFDEERNEEVSIDMLLDMDNEKNNASKETEDSRKRVFNEAAKKYENKADALAYTIESQYTSMREMKYYPSAFNVQQPLRRLFWDAFKNVEGRQDKPDPDKLKVFWDTCKRVTNNPESCVMPTWKMKEEKDANGNPVFVQEKILVPHVVLYRPWTAEPADKVIHPIRLPDEMKARIQAAHEKLAEEKRREAERLEKEKQELARKKQEEASFMGRMKGALNRFLGHKKP